MPFTTGIVRKFANTVITGEVLDDTPDGIKTVFSSMIPVFPPLIKNSITVYFTIGTIQYSETDDGAGSLSNVNGYITSSSINYETGSIDITFNTAPDNTTDIIIDYTAKGMLQALLDFVSGLYTASESIYTGSTGVTVFTGASLTNTPVSKGQCELNFTIASVDYKVYDNGGGQFLHDEIASSSLNYATGALDVTFNTAPDNGSDIFCDYVSGADGQDWRVMMDEKTKDNQVVPQEVYPSELLKQVVLKNTGTSGQDRIFVGMREWYRQAAPAFNWDLNGYILFNEDETDWNASQVNTTYDATWEHWTYNPAIPFRDDVMNYWIYSNKNRIIIVAFVAANYECAYLGNGIRLCEPSAYPYPLYIAGSINGNYGYTDTSGYHGIYWISHWGYWGFYFGTPDSVIRRGYYQVTQNPQGGLMVPTYFDEDTTNILYKTTNDKVVAMPLYLTHPASSGALLQLDGVYFTPNGDIQPEDTVDVGGVDARVFPNVFRTQYHQYFAVKEE